MRASLARPFSSRMFLYVLFGMMALVPVAAFAFGPLTGESFNVEGPGGPFLAFSAGLLSFLSPCVLPMVPIYLMNLSGATIERGNIVADRGKTVRHSIVFVSGFSTVFILLGVGAGLFGSYFFTDHAQQIQQVAGGLMILMGVIVIPTYGSRSPLRSLAILAALVGVFLFLRQVAEIQTDAARQAQLAAILGLTWLRFAGYLELPFLQRTVRLDSGQQRKVGYTRSGLVGASFAAGWTPCIGPVLGSILQLGIASSSAWTATYLMVAYSAGLAVPFLIVAFALGDIAPALRRISRYAPYVEVATGIMLIGVGVLLWTGRLTGLNQFFNFGKFNEGL